MIYYSTDLRLIEIGCESELVAKVPFRLEFVDRIYPIVVSFWKMGRGTALFECMRAAICSGLRLLEKAAPGASSLADCFIHESGRSTAMRFLSKSSKTAERDALVRTKVGRGRASCLSSLSRRFSQTFHDYGKIQLDSSEYQNSSIPFT